MVRWNDGNHPPDPPGQQPQPQHSVHSINSLASTMHPPIHIDIDVVDEDDDAELQAALALSLQQQQQQQPITNTTLTTGQTASSNHRQKTHENNNKHFLSFQDIVEFHKIMWDDHITTDSDKARWIRQCIDVRRHENDSSEPTAAAFTDNDNDNHHHMHRVSTCHTDWGLVQNHGGPCGVLAAVQSEMLKAILFDPNHPDEQDESPTASAYPPKSPTAHHHHHPITMALAKSIAIILARAAIMPSAIIFHPNDDNMNIPNINQNYKNNYIDEPRDVKIILPIKNNDGDGLTWQDLEPWYTNPITTTTSPPKNINGELSSTLVTYTIPWNSNTDVEKNRKSIINNNNNNDDDDDMPESHDVKRQKRLQQQQSQSQEDESSNHPIFHSESSPTTTHHRIRALARTVERFLLQEYHNPVPNEHVTSSSGGGRRHHPPCPLDAFRRPGGVLLLVLSLTATRRYDTLRHEFDDAQAKLTGQFGHCAQELINLLLTGQAVSNVFDNTLNVGMVCRGIQYQPSIGYLSQLEAMRYCEVGSYYKSPQFPIWVVGSTSHFTVLFGEPAALKESQSDVLLDECRRAFKSVEGGEENGFIAKDQLSAVLDRLKLDLGGATEADRASCIQTLAESLEVAGAGIILWDDFWKAASRLMTGASLLAVLQGSSSNDGSCPSIPVSTIQDNDDEEEEDEFTPLLVDLPMFPAKPDQDITAAARIPSSNNAGVTGNSGHIETDEEMARRLAAEWNSGNEGLAGLSVLSNAAAAAGNSSPMEVDQTMTMVANHTTMSDEEMARKLQDQWDAEDNAIAGNGDSSVGAVTGSPVPPLLTDADGDSADGPLSEEPTSFHNRDSAQNSVKEDDKKPAATMTTTREGTTATQFEQFGDTFSLFHYNGLRGGVLTPFRITRLSADEAVGASVALNRGSGGSSHGKSSQDLEDVVRTKWPSCAINWLGKQPPCID